MAKNWVTKLWQHMPPGKAWNRHAPFFNQLFTGIAVEFSRVDQRCDKLEQEMDPRTTVELLPDWERVAGLPGTCAPPPTTIEGRQRALTARIVSRGGWSGGPSVPFLKSVIVALGYDIDDIIIRRFHHQPFTCNSPCDDPLNSDDVGWIFLWEIIVKHGALDDVVACEVARYAPGHVGLTFAFPLVLWEQGTFNRTGSAAVFTNPVNGDQRNVGADAFATVYVGEGENTNYVEPVTGAVESDAPDGELDFSNPDQSAFIPQV